MPKVNFAAVLLSCAAVFIFSSTIGQGNDLGTRLYVHTSATSDQTVDQLPSQLQIPYIGKFSLLKNFRGRSKPRKFNTRNFLNDENLQTESPGPLVASPQSSGVFLIPYS